MRDNAFVRGALSADSWIRLVSRGRTVAVYQGLEGPKHTGLLLSHPGPHPVVAGGASNLLMSRGERYVNLTIPVRSQWREIFAS